ncbi:hypothetical protein E4T52_16859 [Aureobasidium sp. EXF-3400]|nr:hypothetical protein E4T52_16859 [Aureobasidium sp. EXF-3400]
MAPLQARRRTTTTTERAALRRHAQHSALNQQQLASWFEEQFGHRPSPGTISESLSARFKELDTTNNDGRPQKRLRTHHWPELETCLYDTYLERPYQGCHYTLLAPSTYIPRHAGTRFSNGWLKKFKRRHGISEYTRHGEASSVDQALSGEQLVAAQAIAAQFYASNTYNCDESGLLWKTHEKARITAHSCCTADGSHKPPIWFIGKHQKPRCFGAANINLNSLGCYWRYNGKVWMKIDIMTEWLYEFDQQVAARKVLVLMDNFSLMPLQNTVICWLPPNATSKVQALDQGIIRTWKAYYRKQWLVYIVDQFETGENSLKTTNVPKSYSLVDSSMTSCLTTAGTVRLLHQGLLR